MGATLLFSNGTGSVIPPGALSQSTTVTITEAAFSSAPPLPSYLKAVGDVYYFDSGSITLTGSVSMFFPYNPANIPSGITTGELEVIFYNGSAWVEAPSQAQDTVNHVFTVISNHFSPWGVAGNQSSTFTPVPTDQLTLTVIPTNTSTSTITPTFTPTTTATYTSCVTPTQTLTNTPTFTPTLTGATPSPSESPTVTSTKTPTVTSTMTATYTSCVTPIQTLTNTPTFSPTLIGGTPSPTVSPTFTPTTTATYTSCVTPTQTLTTTPTFTLTFTPTLTGGTPSPSESPTVTSTKTPTVTSTMTATYTSCVTPIQTLTNTPTFSPTLIGGTPSPTVSPTFTPTTTATYTSCVTPIQTLTTTPTFTLTFTPTLTGGTLSPTVTPTQTTTQTTTLTMTATYTATNLGGFTSTITETPTITNTPCPFFGNPNYAGDQYTSPLGVLDLNPFQASTNVTLYQLVSYFNNDNWPNSNPVYVNFVIYSDDGTGLNPTVLIAQTGPVTVVNTQPYAGSLATPVPLQAGQYYWLGMITYSPTGSTNSYIFQTGSGTYAEETSANYSTLSVNDIPSSFSGNVVSGSSSKLLALWSTTCP